MYIIFLLILKSKSAAKTNCAQSDLQKKPQQAKGQAEAHTKRLLENQAAQPSTYLLNAAEKM